MEVKNVILKWIFLKSISESEKKRLHQQMKEMSKTKVKSGLFEALCSMFSHTKRMPTRT